VGGILVAKKGVGGGGLEGTPGSENQRNGFPRGRTQPPMNKEKTAEQKRKRGAHPRKEIKKKLKGGEGQKPTTNCLKHS